MTSPEVKKREITRLFSINAVKERKVEIWIILNVHQVDQDSWNVWGQVGDCFVECLLAWTQSVLLKCQCPASALAIHQNRKKQSLWKTRCQLQLQITWSWWIRSRRCLRKRLLSFKKHQVTQVPIVNQKAMSDSVEPAMPRNLEAWIVTLPQCRDTQKLFHPKQCAKLESKNTNPFWLRQSFKNLESGASLSALRHLSECHF